VSLPSLDSIPALTPAVLLMRNARAAVRRRSWRSIPSRPAGRRVSEGEIMRLCGWRTRAMFDRYNIIDEQDLARAVAKRFAPTPAPNGIVPA
jgi:hypothetical protein